MSNEIQIAYPTGAALYAVILRPADGDIYNAATPGFEAILGANWVHYAVALAEQGTNSGLYEANFPAIAAGSYSVVVYKQAGGAAALGDRSIGVGKIEWSGTAEVPLSGTMPANVVQVGGQTASAAAPVTFPASIGTSTFSGGAVASVTLPVSLPGTPPSGYGGPSIVVASGAVQASPTPTGTVFAISGVGTSTTPATGAWVGQVAYRPATGERRVIAGHTVSGSGGSAIHTITLGASTGINGPFASAPAPGESIDVA